jgi:HlyD family secretion protein
MKKKLPILVALVVVGAGLGYWYLAAAAHARNGPLRVSGNIEVTEAEVSFKLPGRVVERLVDEGQLVKAGQVVARLETADLQGQAALREAEVETAQAALRELEAGSRPCSGSTAASRTTCWAAARPGRS